MLDRTQLQEAIAVLSAERARLGETVVATTLAVLRERERTAPLPAGASPAAEPGEQRKQVTILFAAIDGLTRLSAAPNTEKLRQIDLLWRRLDEIIYSHGGLVDKHMGDVVMGIFGAPLARENDPERAVQCGLALREAIDELVELDPERFGDGDRAARPIIRVGINTGQVSLGRVGSDADQTVIGDAVNVASRLKDATGEAGIYISQDTYRLVRHSFVVAPLGEVVVKGRQTPVIVYRVVGPQPRLFFTGSEGVEGVVVPMIGRRQEMAALRAALEETAQTGRGRLITIVGDAGVGKSRLLREFHRRLDEFPLKPTLFQGRAEQRLTQVPYGLARDMLIRHFGIAENDRAATIQERLVAGLAANLPTSRRVTRSAGLRDRALAIGRLTGLSLPALLLRDWAGPEDSTQRERAITTLLEYFQAVSRRSAATVFFVEDIHWADEDSLDLLQRLAALTAEAPLLIICLTRPMLFERRAWPGAAAGVAETLPLSPLSETDSRELVLTILRKLPQIPPALSDLIVQSAAGNPFYVEELVRVLIEDGVIIPTDEAWHVRPRELTRLRVPATLTGVLQARLDRLPEIERVTLQQAAVIGDDFWAEAVQQMNAVARFPLAEAQVAAALEALVRRDMIYRASATALPGGPAYLFKHAVLREVAYESVLLRDRLIYHLQAARWLETQSADRAAEYAAPIAQHYEAAGRAADAAHHYEIAAGRAAEQFKIGPAIVYYRKVLELLKDQPQYLDTRLAVLNRLGRALRQEGRLVEALDTYRAMHDGAQRDGNLPAQARAENAQAAVLLELDDAIQAAAAAARAEELARLGGAELEVTRALLLQGEAAGLRGDARAAARAAHAAVERARALDAPRETAYGLALLALHGPAGENDEEGRAALAELAALSDTPAERQRPADAAYVLAHRGWLALELGHAAEARALLQQALAGQRAEGDQQAAAETLRRLGLAACRLGEDAAAGDYLEEAAALAEATGSRYLRLHCRLAMGEALLAQEHYLAAEATLRQVIAAAEDARLLGRWRELPHAYGLLVKVLRGQGRHDEAALLENKKT